MADKRQGESEVEHPRKKNCFAVRRPSLAVVDVLRLSGRAAVPQYCKLSTACLRSVVPEAFSSAISAAIRKDFGTKTEVSHDGAPFRRAIEGWFFISRRNPRSEIRQIRGCPAPLAFPAGYLGFRARICLGGCPFLSWPLGLYPFAGRRDR